MDAAAVRGFALFNGRANCAACHGGWRLTDDSFHDIGLASGDIGRGAQLPEIPMMRHAFKTPTLRNVAGRGPYMHDGSARTLREAVLHYDTGFVERPSLSAEVRRLILTPREVDDLVAFLRALTSEDDPIPAPVLPTHEE
jgi:cytochrome c peroxidase